MSIDILNMRRLRNNEQSVEIALPVFAIECEVKPPISNHLDAYEEAVLKFLSIGLSASSIYKSLNATESLVDEILYSLEKKNFAQKKSGYPWEITEDGQKYLNGVIEDRESESSQFGFMFVNAIKKEILPYFFLGDLSKVPMYNGKLPAKLTVNGDEYKTFESVEIKPSKLRDAYRNYFKISEVSKQYAEQDITKEEAVDIAEDIFEDVEVFDEVESFEDVSEKIEVVHNSLKKNMFIRKLNRPYKEAYLTMRITIDPRTPGGYHVESPFELNGIDNSFFLRQIQWLLSSGNVFIGNKSFNLFILDEIQKLCPNYSERDEDFSVFVMERMPWLGSYRSRFEKIYSSMSQIYSLMQRADDLMAKENIVSNISKYVVEALFNEFFRGIDEDERIKISNIALGELSYYGIGKFKRNLVVNTRLDADKIYWEKNPTYNALKRLQYTKGNSIVEKYINLIVFNHYYGTAASRTFLSHTDVDQLYRISVELNRIRNKVSHDTDESFTETDYEKYIGNVFYLINALLEALKES